MKESRIYDVTGVMSGTSLDGLDVALCRFFVNGNEITFKILHAETIAYDEYWKSGLSTAHSLNAIDFCLLDNEYGRFIGSEVRKIIQSHQFNPVCVSSHGHTVMHEPSKRLTVQIGNGACIAAESGLDTVCDFRALDVAMGGQGAPLVPFGDLNLFSEYESALNLGGFSNITIMKPGMQPLAFDICPVNFVLNELAKQRDMEFDRGGEMASRGKLMKTLLEKFEHIDHYNNETPVSLSREWVEQHIFPLLELSDGSTEDLLRTYTEHAALRIGNVLNTYNIQNCLITGGGVYNAFLINRLRNLCVTKLIIPDDLIVQYKEALVFAFLGLKRLIREVNVLSCVTRATHDTISGTLWKSG